jgi:hypothetical protein
MQCPPCAKSLGPRAWQRSEMKISPSSSLPPLRTNPFEKTCQSSLHQITTGIRHSVHQDSVKYTLTMFYVTFSESSWLSEMCYKSMLTALDLIFKDHNYKSPKVVNKDHLNFQIKVKYT